jgi:virulence-associated protein VagC
MQGNGLAVVRRLGRFGAMAVLAFAVAGCSMGGMFGGGNNTAQQFQNANPDPSEIAAINALPAIATECPEIKVRPGSEALFFYGRGKAGDPRDLHYQAVLDRNSRNCVVSNGLITVKMGVSGRVMLGPKGSEQSVKVPVRFSVERDNVAVFSERYELPVTITPPNQSSDFVKVVENVTIPYVGGETIIIWVGFDPRG